MAHLRALWLAIVGVKELSDLRTMCPETLLEPAERIVLQYASMSALEDMAKEHNDVSSNKPG